MTLNDLNGKNICLVGYGLEGQAMHKALHEHAPNAQITAADANPAVTADGAALQVGPDYLADLNRFDVIIRSAGIPNLPELKAVAAKTTDMTRIFFDTIAGTGVHVVGVTGSKGKSTTTTLIYNALKAYNPDHTFLMGNLYLPMIDFVNQAEAGNVFVIEMSSYMLEHLQRSPHIAVVTSFFPEHLDRHGSVQNYWAAKRNIAVHQTAEDVVFYNGNSPECKDVAESSPGSKVAFKPADFPLKLAETKFIGEHNRSNLAAAFKVALHLGVPEDVALKALKTTEPLPHRLQNVGVHAGITWVNDSIATAPEATLAALQALGPDVETIFLGGFDRGYDFSQLAATIADSPNLKNIVLFPDTGAKIKPLLPASKNIFATEDMQVAVHWASQHTAPGKTALLSCASPSFNLYKDFNARGEAFVNAVQTLKS